jgi:hypothetical protein
MLRPTVSLGSWCQATIWGLQPDFSYCRTVLGLLMWALSLMRERVCRLQLLLALASSHSWVWVPRDSWPYFTVSDSRIPKPGGPGPRIYIPREQGGPVIPPGTGFPFRHLLRVAGLWWGYSNPPPRHEHYPLLITSRHGPRRRHSSSIVVIQLLRY